MKWNNETKFSKQRTCATPDKKNHWKKKTLQMWLEKYVETYFLSNAAAQYPEEKVN